MPNKCTTCGKFYGTKDHACLPPVFAQCLKCGKTFKTYRSYIKSGQGRYCSHACRLHLLDRTGTKLTDEQRKNVSEGLKKAYPIVLCNTRYKDRWGKTVVCKNPRKRYRKTCTKHNNHTQRYFPASFDPYLYIDIEAKGYLSTVMCF